MAGERFTAFFCFKYAEVPAAATKTKRAGVFLLLFLVLARVLPLHGASSSRRRMRTEAPPTSLLFFLVCGSGLFPYTKKNPKKIRREALSLPVNSFGGFPVATATGCRRLTEQDMSVRAIFLGDQRRRVLTKKQLGGTYVEAG